MNQDIQAVWVLGLLIQEVQKIFGCILDFSRFCTNFFFRCSNKDSFDFWKRILHWAKRIFAKKILGHISYGILFDLDGLSRKQCLSSPYRTIIWCLEVFEKYWNFSDPERHNPDYKKRNAMFCWISKYSRTFLLYSSFNWPKVVGFYAHTLFSNLWYISNLTSSMANMKCKFILICGSEQLRTANNCFLFWSPHQTKRHFYLEVNLNVKRTCIFDIEVFYEFIFDKKSLINTSILFPFWNSILRWKCLI